MGNLSRAGRRAFAARDDSKFRHVDAMVAENLFRDGLVFAERETGGAAAGERDAVHFKERNDVLIERAVVFELVGEVEHDVRLETIELLAQQIEVVEDREVFDRVAEFGERGEDVGLGFPIVGLQFGAEVLINGRRRDGVEQGEDFEFLSSQMYGDGLHYFVRLNLPVNK
jgi:hypothetical protein